MPASLPLSPRVRHYGTGLGMAACAAFISSQALAQNTASVSNLMTPDNQEDWAGAILDFLFHGGTLPPALSAYGARLAPITETIQQALGAYSAAMLVLAGIILLYYLVTFIVDTAHTGIVMGRRANQIWAPIRLVVAILLLVPIGHLSAGQYLVLKVAKIGSSIASHAWEAITVSAGTSFSTLVTPHAPPLTSLVANSVEMELCHLIYQQTYAGYTNNATVQMAGNITTLNKTPISAIAPETWGYSNSINSTVPLCGQYMFAGYRVHNVTASPYTDDTARIADDLSVFSHAEAESLNAQSRNIASRIVTSFSDKGTTDNLSIQDELSSMEKSLTADIDSHLQSVTDVNVMLSSKLVTQPAQIGWLAAGFMLPVLLQVQESYNELISDMLPTVQSPAFNHPALARQVLDDAVTNSPYLVGVDNETLVPLTRFYGNVAKNMERAHNWLYGGQLPDGAHILTGEFDIASRLDATTDSHTLNGLIIHALDEAGMAYGVWGQTPLDVDNGYPFAPLSHTRTHNPFSAAIDFGHRQMLLGTYLMGIAGSALPHAHVGFGAYMAGGLACLLLLGAAILTFAVPLLPFIRFIAGVMAWLLEVFEGIAAIPLVAIAHLSPTGDGVSGAAARQAYRLWLGILARPVLTLLGFAVGMVLFTLGTSMIEVALLFMARLSAVTNSGIFMVANCATVLLYDILLLAVANVAFKGIYAFPDRALRWMTPLVQSEGGIIENDTPITPQQNSGTTQTNMLTQLSAIIQNSTSKTTTNTTTGSSGNYGPAAALMPVQHRDPDASKTPGNTTNVNTASSQTSSTKGATTTSSSSVTSSSTTQNGTSRVPTTETTRQSPYANAPHITDKNKPE